MDPRNMQRFVHSGSSNPEYNAQGYRRDVSVTGLGTNAMVGTNANAMAHLHTQGMKRKSAGSLWDDDSYFDDDEETERKQNEILAGCPFLSETEKKTSKRTEDEDEEDPLDAFMASIETQVTKQTEKSKPAKKEEKGIRDDLEELDSDELYYKFVKENPNAGKMFLDEDDEVDYDEDGNPIPVAVAPNKKLIDPLPVIYHSEIDYPPFERNFYREHTEIQCLSVPNVNELRAKLGISVSGYFAPKPVSSFGHFGFDERLMSSIRKQGYTQPTPIQAQALPCAMSGRDIIGIAKTGSGKTAAFLWPLLIHAIDQTELKEGDGPVGLIVAPTRELCQQIHTECRKFGKVYGLRSVCCFGGGNMHDQQKGLADGCEIVVATPGRIIDHIKRGNTNFRRVTYLVFDEADRMFEMGFEYQVRSIANHIRPDRQTLLFSATFRRRIERLARDVLCDPIRIIQGDIGEANTDVTQVVEVFQTQESKWRWLISRIIPFTAEGSLLVFVTKKTNSEELATNLQNEGYDVALIHGDMNQFNRNDVISNFKKKQVATLVATDVAARGLDIPSIRNVVNYDVARDIDTHTHRIGRTGRAGQKGTAYTLVTPKDSQFAGDLVRNLEVANQQVPAQLMQLALQNSKFRKTRSKHGREGKQISNISLRERPGLGSSPSSAAHSGGPMTGYGQSSSGVLGGRASSVKDYFKSQYKANFVQSSEPASNSTWNSGDSFKIPGVKKKKRSRWDTDT